MTVRAPSPLWEAPCAAPADGRRRVEWSRSRRAELGDTGLTLLVDMRHPDGRPFMSIDRYGDGGYRVGAPGHGVHRVEPDGSRIRSSVAPSSTRWKRLLFAQVLPLAAALNGLELFHASAVALDGHAVAFTGSPGVGKTSIAAHLVALGAGFVTDDVLAVEPDAPGVLAHPGPALANVEPDELARLRGAVAGEAEPGSDGKHAIRPTPVDEPLPLGAVCLLARVPPDEPLELRREPAGLTPALLGSAFLAYLQSPARLAAHLDVCSRVAASCGVFQLRIPRGRSARETAAFVHDELTRSRPW